VKKVQGTDWGVVRERFERGAGEVVGAVRGSVPKGVQDGLGAVKEGVAEVVQESVPESMQGERILEKVARGKQL
jgi:hypothetical protein